MNTHKILIIDDEENLTKMLKLNLDDTGKYDVRTLNNPIKALETVREFQPDLILLDVMMPGIQGNEIATQILEDDEISHVKIIFLTAIVTKSDMPQDGNTIGGRKFIAKPVQIDELIAVIDGELS